MLRPFHRAPSSSIFLGGPSIRTNVRKPLALTTKCLCKLQQQQTRHSTTTTTTPTYDSTTTPPPSNPSNPPNHPISNPTLVDIEKRWVPMPPEEQAELWMALRDRMKNDWHDLSFQERKAGKCTLYQTSGSLLSETWDSPLIDSGAMCQEDVVYFHLIYHNAAADSYMIHSLLHCVRTTWPTR